MGVDVAVVRVFTTRDGRLGNELGIIEGGAHTDGRQQAIAAELGFSETVFIDSLVDAVATVRIFTPGGELPFAGHPSVGTAWWLKDRGTPITTLAEGAGDVAVDYDKNNNKNDNDNDNDNDSDRDKNNDRDNELTWITGRGEWAPDFEWIELASVAELDALDPDDFTEGQRYFYTWTDEQGGALRSRMFAPELSVNEDQATGAAAVALAARLGRDLDITQGLGCRLFAQRLDDGFVRVGGYTVFDRSLTLP